MRCRSVFAAISLFAAALSAQSRPDSADKYPEIANRLVDSALADSSGYAKLAYLCDYIGNRLAGSEHLNEAVRWVASQMQKDGLVHVSTPPVTVEKWVRGHESLTLQAPVTRSLPMLGLGNSVGTPAGGITAQVVAVSSFDQLEKLGRDGVQGKIVLYNVPWVSYGDTVQYRGYGPSRAAKLGAVATLVRTVGSASLRTPHTGALQYDSAVAKIPAAAVTWEDAMMMQRMIDRGDTVRVRLAMEAHFEGPAQSANVIGEIPGSERPDEVIVMGGHLDSWDVGQGAVDDGSGVVAAMQAAYLIKQLGLKPRRTIRVVAWTNEENGEAGGKAYREMIGNDVAKHVAAIEMDGGAEQPVGFETTTRDARQLAILRSIAPMLERTGATRIIEGGSETDIQQLVDSGVPGLGLRTVMTHYFDWHHSEADTVDKVKPEEFQKNVAALAVMAFVLADLPDTIR